MSANVMNTTATTALATSSDMQSYLNKMLGAALVIILVWRLLMLLLMLPWFGASRESTSARSHQQDDGSQEHISRSNYLLFLQTCRDMFTMLAVLSTFMLMPLWGCKPFLAGLAGGKVSLVAHFARADAETDKTLDEARLIALYCTTILYGIVFILAIVRYHRNYNELGVSRPNRTIWLQKLPKGERSMWSKPFDLTDEELQRVQSDLTLAFEQAFEREDAQAKGAHAHKCNTLLPSETMDSNIPPRIAAFDQGLTVRPEQSGSYPPTLYNRSVASEPCIHDSWIAAESTSNFTVGSNILIPEQVDNNSRVKCLGDKGLYLDGKTKEIIFIKKGVDLKVVDPKASRIQRVQVVPVVDKLYNTSMKRRTAEELVEVYGGLRDKAVGVVRKWYNFRRERQKKKFEQLVYKELRLILGKKCLSGSAFVTLRDQRDCGMFLHKAPQCSELLRWIRSDSVFSFGRPPFAAVTLRCQRAPLPTDVNWQNLHMSRWACKLRVLLFGSFGFLVMVALSFYAVNFKYIVEHSNDVERHWAKKAGNLPWLLRSVLPFVLQWDVHRSHLLDSMTTWLPPQLLLVINSVVLPYIIYFIALAERSKRKSEEEIRQMSLNFWFLVLISLILPFLGVSNPSIIDAWRKVKIDLSFIDLSKFLAFNLIEHPGTFVVKYIISVVCVGNAMQLLKVPLYKLFQQVWKSLVVMSYTDLKEWMKPLPFPWGFWYAFMLGNVAISISMSVFVPSTLPIAALFFAVRHQIDAYNLQWNFDLGPDGAGTLAAHAVHLFRIIFCVWFGLMGAFFVGICSVVGQQGEDCGTCPCWLQAYGAYALLGVAFAAFVLSMLLERIAMRREQTQDDDKALVYNGLDTWNPAEVRKSDDDDDQRLSMDPRVDNMLKAIQERLDQDPAQREKALERLETQGLKGVCKMLEVADYNVDNPNGVLRARSF